MTPTDASIGIGSRYEEEVPHELPFDATREEVKRFTDFNVRYRLAMLPDRNESGFTEQIRRIRKELNGLLERDVSEYQTGPERNAAMKAEGDVVTEEPVERMDSLHLFCAWCNSESMRLPSESFEERSPHMDAAAAEAALEVRRIYDKINQQNNCK